jgi:hypothetical protein
MVLPAAVMPRVVRVAIVADRQGQGSVVKDEPEIYPYGYQSETSDGPPSFRRHTEYGWEVRRRYTLYDGRPSIELVAVFRTEREAIDLEARILAAISV